MTKRNTAKWVGIIMLTLFFSASLFAQGSGERGKISGTVNNAATGDPLIGANVVVSGTILGASTDSDGYFLIDNVPAGDYEVAVYYIGYTGASQNVTVGSGTVQVTFQLSTDVLGFDEIVVTGSAGATSKRQLGNTIATVQGESIIEARTVDISGALSGKFAGVQVTQNSGDPAAGISVRLRSASTVNGSSDPLYIIDGVIVNNNSNNILGVQSVVQNRLSDVNPADIERIEVIKGGAAAAIYGSRASNGVVQIFTKRGQIGKPRITFGTSVNFNSLRKKIDFNQAPKDWVNAGDVTDLSTVDAERFDYQDLVFRNSTGTDNYMSVAGGVGNTTYFGSASFLSNNGIMESTSFDRSSVRLRINQIISDRASFSVGTYVSSSNSDDMPNGGYGSGVIQSILFSNNSIDPSPDADGNYPQMTFYPNILEYIETFDFEQQNKRAISDLQFTFLPFDGLQLNYVLGYDDSRSTGTTYTPIGTTTSSLGSARSTNINQSQLNSDISATYQTQLSAPISSNTAAGYSYQYDEFERGSITATGLAIGVQTTDGAASVSTGDFNSARSIWGGYVQQTFGFQNKLFLTGAARIDGSSVFGDDERNQFYPKGSLSYILSEEGFWKIDAINNLKLRAAWGQAGNLTAIGPFDRLTNYSAVSINGQSGLISPSLVGNPDLKPERQTETEFGLDLGMFNNRVGLEVTGYFQTIEDLLVARTLAPSTGAGSRIENIADMENKGIELQLTMNPVAKRDFNWFANISFSSNKNEVNGVEGDQIGIGNFGFSKARNGEPLGIFYQSYFARNADGSLLLDANGLPQRERGSVDANGVNMPERDENGQPTGAILQKKIGDPNPSYVASLTNQFQYKNWTFRTQFDAVQGFDVLSWDSRMFFRFGGGVQTERELNGEEAKGTGAAKFGIAEAYIEDGSFIKLRELSLSYLWNSPFMSISSVRFTLAGRNLFSFDDYSKWDPEVNMDAQSNGSRGGIMGLTPIPRVITFGISVAN